MRRHREDRGMNIFEMPLFLLMYAAGFVPGYLIAQRAGLISGVRGGFIISYALVLVCFRIDEAIEGKQQETQFGRPEQDSESDENKQQAEH